MSEKYQVEVELPSIELKFYTEELSNGNEALIAAKHLRYNLENETILYKIKNNKREIIKFNMETKISE